MASGPAVQAKVAAVLTKLNPTSRVVKFRELVATGGNQLLGLGVDNNVVDTLVDPPPSVEVLAASEVSISGGLYQLGDYRFTFAGTVAESVIKNSLILYGEELVQTVHIVPYALGGIVVAWSVVGRSVKAP